MNPLTSPTWMTWLNVAATAYGALESTGVINLLGSRAGYAIALGGVINSIAHAFSPPTAGPMSSVK
jgi:hypothetical protein